MMIWLNLKQVITKKTFQHGGAAIGNYNTLLSNMCKDILVHIFPLYSEGFHISSQAVIRDSFQIVITYKQMYFYLFPLLVTQEIIPKGKYSKI